MVAGRPRHSLSERHFSEDSENETTQDNNIHEDKQRDEEPVAISEIPKTRVFHTILL